MVLDRTSEEIARNAGLFKTKYGSSLTDGFVLAGAVDCGTEVLVMGEEKQYEEEWKNVVEVKVEKLGDFVKKG